MSKKQVKQAKSRKLNLLELLWLGAPLSIWFSFHPLIRMGKSETMYFELSITMIYLLFLALVSIPTIWRQRKRLISSRAVQGAALFVAVSSMGLLWTQNVTRGVLATGVLGMLFLALLGAYSLGSRFMKITPQIVRIYIASAVAACILAVIQFFAGVWLSSDATLLCAGCVAEQFGFVRPNLFLIEPQFLGSALLPAGIIMIHRFLAAKHGFRWLEGVIVVVISTTLVLTLSRGALAAFAVGVAVLVMIHYRQVLSLATTGALLFVSLVVALCFQGLAASINPRIDDTFMSAVSRSVNQLSMGVIELPFSREADASQPVPTPNIQPGNSSEQQPNFDGYVEESTSARTTRTSMAIGRWRQDAQTVLFGTGVGSAGVAMHEKYSSQIGAREIVQNEYAEILLERGLLGLVAWAMLLAGIFWLSRDQRWLWAIIAAFMVQWIFFSGYPNALHIYLTLIVISVYAIQHRGQSKPAKQY